MGSRRSRHEGLEGLACCAGPVQDREHRLAEHSEEAAGEVGTEGIGDLIRAVAEDAAPPRPEHEPGVAVAGGGTEDGSGPGTQRLGDVRGFPGVLRSIMRWLGAAEVNNATGTGSASQEPLSRLTSGPAKGPLFIPPAAGPLPARCGRRLRSGPRPRGPRR